MARTPAHGERRQSRHVGHREHGNAVLVSAEDYTALREGAYLLRSPANARRLLKAYENALNGIHLAEHALIDPGTADAR
jgi:antitoxin YefM